jgi:hypothetical protein
MSDESGFRETHLHFLTIELNLAATFIRTADRERGLDGKAELAALSNAREALDTVTRLLWPHRLTAEQVSMILSRQDALEERIQGRVGRQPS